MAHFSVRIFFKSFGYAAKGLRYAFRCEQSFRVQVTIALIVLILMLALRVSRGEVIILLLTISSVLVLELLNTVLEKFVDILKPRVHPFVETIKDIMAAAVFVASVASFFIGLLIFVPYIIP